MERKIKKKNIKNNLKNDIKEKMLLPPSYAKERREELKNKTVTELRGICRKYNIQFLFLKEKEIRENIDAWIDGKKLPHNGNDKTPREKLNVKKMTMTPRMRRFAFEYSGQLKRKKKSYWAKKFGVSQNTIWKWLNKYEVIELIGKFTEKREDLIDEKFNEYATDAIDCLLFLIKNAKSEDTRRKAIQDFFGYMGRKNVNTGVKMILNQQQGQISDNRSINVKTDEELNEELNKELNDLNDLE